MFTNGLHQFLLHSTQLRALLVEVFKVKFFPIQWLDSLSLLSYFAPHMQNMTSSSEIWKYLNPLQLCFENASVSLCFLQLL